MSADNQGVKNARLNRILLSAPPLLLTVIVTVWNGISWAQGSGVDAFRMAMMLVFILATVSIMVPAIAASDVSEFMGVLVSDFAAPAVATGVALGVHFFYSGDPEGATNAVTGSPVGVATMMFAITLLGAGIKITHVFCKQKLWKPCQD